MSPPPPGPRPAPSAIQGSIEKPKTPASALGKPEGLSRPAAAGCLEAVTLAMHFLEEKEREGHLQDYEVYVESVVDLRDKLELYMMTAAPGESFRPTDADITAAGVAADLLENA